MEGSSEDTPLKPRALTYTTTTTTTTTTRQYGTCKSDDRKEKTSSKRTATPSTIRWFMASKLHESVDDPVEQDLHFYFADEDDGTTTEDPSGPRDMTKVLPARIVMQILLQLDPADLCAVACVSKRWKRVADSHRVWESVCVRELAATMPVEDICVDNRDYKQLLKTEWLIRKWKHSHAPRAPLQSEEEQAKEDYRQLNFQFEEKMLDLKDMVSYKLVLLLRLFNSPIVDYVSFVLLLAASLLVGLRLDRVIVCSWAWVFVPLWLVALLFFAGTATWFFFVARGLMDTDFMQRCLFGWINVLCCSFSDDTTESTLWFVSATGFALLPLTLGLYLVGALPQSWPGSPFVALFPAWASTVVLLVSLVRSIVVRASNAKGIKTVFAACCVLVAVFLLFLAMRLAGALSWDIWRLGAPLWVGYCIIEASGFALCDPRFYRQSNWLKNGLVVAVLVLLALAPCVVQQLLLSLRISGRCPHMSYSLAMLPAHLANAVVLVLLIFADCHFWQRTKHFWVFKRSYKGPLKEHWRRSDSVIVMD